MPRRTRACLTCRQKRIKCDATMPHCLMCIRFNRQCPGPTDAPLLFVDTSSYPSGKKPRAKKTAPQTNPLEVAGRFEDGRRKVNRVGDLPEELAFVSCLDVSPQHVYQEAFFSNLSRFLCAEGRNLPGAVQRTPNWLHKVPHMAATPPPSSSRNAPAGNEALSLALRATTAAFSSLTMNNDSLLHHAYGLYGGSLRHQGRVLQEKGGNVGDMYTIMTSVMLTLFESVVATTGEGFALHNIGAAKMIDDALRQASKSQERNAKNGSSGSGLNPMLVNIFFYIRIQLCFVYLTTSDPQRRVDPVMKRVLLEACDWSKENLPLNMQIITPFARLMELQANASQSPAMTPAQFEHGRATYDDAKAVIDQIWQNFVRQNEGQRLRWMDTMTGQTDFRDPFTALGYAYFSACYILLDLLAPIYATHEVPPFPKFAHRPSASPPLSTSPHSASSASTAIPPYPSARTTPPSTTPPSSALPSPHHDTSFLPLATTDHHALILSATRYLRLRDTGFAYLRLHTPLFLVAMYAPTGEQRWRARMVFEEWEGGLLRGIGWLAVRRLEGGG